MTRLFGCLLLLVAVCGACAERRQPRPASTGKDSVLVMTYNVNFGLAGDPETLEAIRSADADLVFLQETDATWERSLRSLAHGRYPHVLSARSRWSRCICSLP